MMLANGQLVIDEIDTMIKQSQDVLRWYDGMMNPVPTWYLIVRPAPYP
jgi:hypothetical protein